MCLPQRMYILNLKGRNRTNGRSKARHKYNYLLNRLICGKGFIIINFRLQQKIITSVSQSLHSTLHLQSLSILYLPRMPDFHWRILRKRTFQRFLPPLMFNKPWTSEILIFCTPPPISALSSHNQKQKALPIWEVCYAIWNYFIKVKLLPLLYFYIPYNCVKHSRCTHLSSAHLISLERGQQVQDKWNLKWSSFSQGLCINTGSLYWATASYSNHLQLQWWKSNFATNRHIYHLCSSAKQKKAKVRLLAQLWFHLKTASLNDWVASPSCSHSVRISCISLCLDANCYCYHSPLWLERDNCQSYSSHKGSHLVLGYFFLSA